MGFTIETHGNLSPHDRQEWLLTNGIGGFASGTVVGLNTRRYHGLLVASKRPPIQRVNTVSRIGETLLVDGRMHELGINAFDSAIHPRGERYLKRFTVGDGVAVWEYEVDSVRVVKRLLIAWGKNASVLRYELSSPEGVNAEIHLHPFVSLRDFHATRRQSKAFRVSVEAGTVLVTDGDQPVWLKAQGAIWTDGPDWWYGHKYPIETERGLDTVEDLFCPGRFSTAGSGSFAVTLALGLGEVLDLNFDTETKLLLAAATSADPRRLGVNSPVLSKLVQAASAFVVDRRTPRGEAGHTILAGYPWFADWGRDTMISLPGLLLTTGRTDIAGQVLTVFAENVSEGMVPNVFDDYSGEPHYNTIDASLWFIHACFAYIDAGGDRELFTKVLHPACRAVLGGYRDGTRYGIKMDPSDSLIRCDDPQLTWMDAKHGETVFTPRSGKAVEINALWYHGLRLMGENELADRAGESFRASFWISPFRGLADRIVGKHRDMSIRPNQIFAASLEHSPLNRRQQQAVVEVCRRELLTPFGLRTLAASDTGYRPRYQGGPLERDSAYHNGTVWPWLIGPFIEAYLRSSDKPSDAMREARQMLTPLVEQMDHAGCLGQLAEVYDADEPRRPAGCLAQAWSIAEVLRIAERIGM